MNDPRERHFRHFPDEIVVERIRRIAGEMVVWVTEIRRIGPHDGWNAGLPERRMVAAVEMTEGLLKAKVNLESNDGKLRNVGRGQIYQILRDGVGSAVREQREKIAGLRNGKRRQPRRH